MNREMLYGKFIDGLMGSLTHVVGPRDKGGGRWPVPTVKNQLEILFFTEPLLMEYFYQWTEELFKQGKTSAEIGKLIYYPSILARLGLCFRTRPVWRFNKAEQHEIAYRMVEILSSMYADHAFTQGGVNHLKSQEEIFEELQNVSLETISKQGCALIGTIDGIMWLYSEVLSPRWNNLHHEFQGPYMLPDGSTLLIKEWHHLRPDCLPFAVTFPFEHIVEYEITPPMSMSIDIHNRFFSEPSVCATLQRYAAICDGVPMTAETLAAKLQESAPRILESGAAYLGKLDRRGMVMYAGQMGFAAIRPLAEALGQEWFPAQKIQERFEQGLTETMKSILAHPVPRDLPGLRRLYDVREDYPTAE